MVAVDAEQTRPRVAVVGSGIAGLGCAYHLRDFAQVTLYEAEPRLGGHTHTIDITLDGKTFGVDTGFLVYNERTYPQLISLFQSLDVPVAKSDMSFSVCLPEIDLEWAGDNLNTIFAQRRNLLRPRFLRMLTEILRFNRLATAMAQEAGDPLFQAGQQEPIEQSLREFLMAHRFSGAFQDWYLLPMAAAIWSCPNEQMLEFPIKTFVRFCDNHGLLQVSNRPAWYTVRGGARQYIDKIRPHIHRVLTSTPVQGVDVSGARPLLHSLTGSEHYDAVVLACHSDQALRILSASTPALSAAQRQVLRDIRYQPNTAYLHTDASLMPKRRKVWSSWNYHSDLLSRQPSVSVTYWLNRLQPLPCEQDVFVTLNPTRLPEASKIIQKIEYSHPVFDEAAIRAQRQLDTVQGRHGIFLAGAWTRYGFHEDGYRSGRQVAQRLREQLEAEQRAAA